jgi:hypothetical protein
MKNLNTKQIIVIAIILIVIYFILKNDIKDLFKSLNPFAESKEEEKMDTNLSKAIDNVNDYFNPLLWQKKPTATVIIGAKVQDKLARQIKDSVGWIYDSPDEMVSAFKQLPNKYSVSALSFAFNRIYKIDLLTYLKEHFDTKEQKDALLTVFNHIKSLPKS